MENIYEIWRYYVLSAHHWVFAAEKSVQPVRAVQSREGGGVISSYDTMTTLGEMLNKIKIAKNEKKSVKSGEITQHETQNRSNSVMRVQTETYTTEK
ncbi:unnamed protein product, partial [Nesidiocoris tenuis]